MDNAFNFEQLKLNALQKKNAAAELASQLDAAKEILIMWIESLTKIFNEGHAELIDAVERSSNGAFEADSDLRDKAKEYYEATGEKQIGFGISVRVNVGYEYDEQKAVDYAISHNMPHLLQVDGTKFKKFASITPMDFVEAKESVTAVVSYTEKSTTKK